MPVPLLVTLLATFILLPTLFGWALVGPARPWTDELAGALGLIGFSALLTNFLLSGRFPAVADGPGIDRTMRWHQLAARVLTIGLLIHPFFYTVADGPAYLRPDDLTRAGMLGLGPWSMVSGVLAWVLLGALTLSSIRHDDLPYRYETWRLMHGICATLVAALGLQHALAAGRYAAHPAVATALVGLAGIALLTLIWINLPRPLLLARRPWRIAGLRPTGLATWELALEPVGHPGLSFHAGQFAWLKLDRGPFARRENPFSIASAPAETGRLRFLVKEAGDFTRGIGALPIGAPAFVDGPHGHLFIDGRPEPGVVLICGGGGVAPAIGIIRQAAASGDHRPMLLLYGNRVEAQILAREELTALAAEGWLEVVHVLSNPAAGWAGAAGQLDADFIVEHGARAAAAGWLFVLCGPTPMLDAAHAALHRLRVPHSRILSERFTFG